MSLPGPSPAREGLSAKERAEAGSRWLQRRVWVWRRTPSPAAPGHRIESRQPRHYGGRPETGDRRRCSGSGIVYVRTTVWNRAVHTLKMTNDR